MRIFRLFLLIIPLLLLSCSSQRDLPAEIVESYYRFLLQKDLNQMLSLVCLQAEGQARTDYESFSAVTAELKDLHCVSSQTEQGTASVTCKGKILANYGNEVLEIDLSRFTFNVIQEAGDWRLCGYR